MKKSVFEVEIDGEKVELAIEPPDTRQKHLAQVQYNKTFKERAKDSILRSALDNLMREQGLWDDDKHLEEKGLWAKLADSQKKLEKGGIKISEARAVAIEMMESRRALQILLVDRNALDVNTVEGQSDNARFNYLVSACTVYNSTGKPFFKSYEDYLERAEEPYSYQAAAELSKSLYGIDDEFESKLPEVKFLKKYGFMDDKNRLVNKEGKFVDFDGKLINEDGRYIDENGNLINRDGDRVDEDGKAIVEILPFLDDDGNAIE